ncbi:MAG: hypothetical protein ACRCT0_11890, partial [Plesiomonas shigelloides]
MALLFWLMLFMAATAAPSLSSEAVITTGIASPVLTFRAAKTPLSKGRIAPGAESNRKKTPFYSTVQK